MLLAPRFKKNNTESRGASKCALLHSLYNREINGNKTRLNVVRATYETLHPNCSILNIKKPTNFIRKFSPDGRHLIAFSNNLTSVEVYSYLGCSMVVDLLMNLRVNNIEKNNSVCSQVFKRLFKLKHRIRVTSEGTLLKRTCCLFTNDGQHVLVGSSSQNSSSYFNIAAHNEFLNPILLSPLEDYILHLVDINNGSVCDSLRFKSDKIILDNNFGIYLYNDTMTVLSFYYQTIYVYNIIDNRFCLLRKIAQFCLEDDQSLVSSVYTFMNNATYKPHMENMINGLKHKLMVFLYKKAEEENRMAKSKNSLGIFYRKFNQVKQYFIIDGLKLLLLIYYVCSICHYGFCDCSY